MNQLSVKKQKWKVTGIGVVVLLLLVILSGCEQGKTASRSDFLLDTFVSITLYGESDESLLDKPFERIAVLNSSLTAFEAGSDLGLIKENAGLSQLPYPKIPTKSSKRAWPILKIPVDIST